MMSPELATHAYVWERGEWNGPAAESADGPTRREGDARRGGGSVLRETGSGVQAANTLGEDAECRCTHCCCCTGSTEKKVVGEQKKVQGV